MGDQGWYFKLLRRKYSYYMTWLDALKYALDFRNQLQ